MLIDTHAHLTDEAFKEDYEEIIDIAKGCGVEKIITSGYNLPSSLEALNFAKKYEGIYCSAGVYPENIGELDDETIEMLFNLCKEEKVVAIGEIGLQYTEDMPLKETQKEGFLRQLNLANEVKKPIIIHCRDAYGDMIELLKKNKNLLNEGGTFHCFSGSGEIAKEVIKLGFHISVGGVSTFKNAQNLKEVLKNVPIENILLETDCPYLTPHPYRGQRNSPCFIPTIAQNLAQIKMINVEDVARITTENARRLFKI